MSWVLNVLMASIFCMGFFLAVWIIGLLKDRKWTKDQQDLWARLLEIYHLVLKDDVDRGFHDRIAALHHYPECWDTVAYPTLYDAVFEMRGPCTTCEVKDPKVDGHVHEWVTAVVKDRPSYDFWLCLKCADVSPGPTDNENLDPRGVDT